LKKKTGVLNKRKMMDNVQKRNSSNNISSLQSLMNIDLITPTTDCHLGEYESLTVFNPYFKVLIYVNVNIRLKDFKGIENKHISYRAGL
jgi:hypothetical protein